MRHAQEPAPRPGHSMMRKICFATAAVLAAVLITGCQSGSARLSKSQSTANAPSADEHNGSASEDSPRSSVSLPYVPGVVIGGPSTESG